MSLRELLNKIISSSKNDWNIIVCWGAPSGPSYRNKFEFYDVYGGRKNVLRSDSHGMVASYKSDLSITLAWGLVANDDFKEAWANKFPDPKASCDFVDIFFNNGLVHREVYVVVDGGRAKLPLPERRDGELVVPRDYSRFVKLLDEIEAYKSEYENYFVRAGLKVVDAEWPK